MKRVFLLAVICVVTLLSCTDRDDEFNFVNIRIQNSTELLFTEVRIAQKDTVYENVEAGKFSEYLEFETASSNVAISIQTDSTSLNYIPTEVSYDSLPMGFYTYEISLDEENKVDVTFRID
ncbi:hypothetical protein LCGC14_0346810 [marine sediment metagenome]|uniref:Uncharacterized protein n=1 Tax=marine sediment metagenome TaxID=412755 RepID=A0A0F9WJU9_9ZZZZ|nr:hypothetical protein [Maribacter sp.]HDZ03705.1 hypothetical protein [Maribacter sp.]HEA79056.1 hypothetical protein [Maribacter sp.]